jgi:hypothetical protein
MHGAIYPLPHTSIWHTHWLSTADLMMRNLHFMWDSILITCSKVQSGIYVNMSCFSNTKLALSESSPQFHKV